MGDFLGPKEVNDAGKWCTQEWQVAVSLYYISSRGNSKPV